jgi:hypothetical protein
MDYFEEYKSLEDRDRQWSGLQKAKKTVKTERDRAEELYKAIENEKELRVK